MLLCVNLCELVTFTITFFENGIKSLKKDFAMNWENSFIYFFQCNKVVPSQDITERIAPHHVQNTAREATVTL